MSGEEDEASVFASRIAELTQNYWDQNQKALLASAVGKHLRREFKTFKEIAPNGLLKFLEARPVVNVVRHPTKSEKIGYVPLSADIPQELTELFVDDGLGQVQFQNRQHLSGLADSFWKAFYRPLRGQRLVILNNKKNTFRLSGSDYRLPDEVAYEITYEDLCHPPSDSDRESFPDHNRRAIGDWLGKHGLDESLFQKDCFRESFIQQSEPTLRDRPVLRNRPGELSKDTDDTTYAMRLAAAFAKLDERDLMKISIPLDIVLKML